MQTGWGALGVVLTAVLYVAACSASPPPPGYVLVPEAQAPPPPGPAAYRALPQISHKAGTYCLSPPESGVRVFVNGDPGYNSFSMSMLDVRGRPHGDPWACV